MTTQYIYDSLAKTDVYAAYVCRLFAESVAHGSLSALPLGCDDEHDSSREIGRGLPLE